jgi:hypothetical protein
VSIGDGDGGLQAIKEREVRYNYVVKNNLLSVRFGSCVNHMQRGIRIRSRPTSSASCNVSFSSGFINRSEYVRVRYRPIASSSTREDTKYKCGDV